MTDKTGYNEREIDLEALKEELLSEHAWERIEMPHRKIIILRDLTTAYDALLECADIRPGMKVFCSDFIPDGAIRAIKRKKGIPVFIDSEYDTWNMDPKALECAFDLYSNAGIVIVNHLNGVPAKIDQIAEIAKAHHACLIEELSESMGSSYHGKLLGQFGSFAVASIPEYRNGTALVVLDADFMWNLKFEYQQIENPLSFLEQLCHGANPYDILEKRETRLEQYDGKRKYMRNLLKDTSVWFQFEPSKDIVVDSPILGILPDFSDEAGNTELIKSLEKTAGMTVTLPIPAHLRKQNYLCDFVVHSKNFRCHCGPGVFVGKGENYQEVSSDLYRRALCVPVTFHKK